MLRIIVLVVTTRWRPGVERRILVHVYPWGGSTRLVCKCPDEIFSIKSALVRMCV